MEIMLDVDDDDVGSAAWSVIEHDVQMLIDSKFDDLLAEHFDDAVEQAVKSQVTKLIEGQFNLDEQYVANAVRSELSKMITRMLVGAAKE